MSFLKEFLTREVSILMTLHESGDGGLILETDQASCQNQLSQRVRELPIAEKYEVKVIERWNFWSGWQKDYHVPRAAQRFKIPISSPVPTQDKVLVTSDTL